MTNIIVSPIGTLSYPFFFKPKPKAKDNPALVYETHLLLTAQQMKTDAFRALKTAIETVAKEAFPKGVLGQTLRSPLRRADEKEKIPDGYEMFFKTWSYDKPGVVDAAKNDILDSADVWPGQWARVSIIPKAFDVSGNKGVYLYLQNVQIIRSAGLKRLDDRKSAKETFDDEYAGANEEI